LSQPAVHFYVVDAEAAPAARNNANITNNVFFIVILLESFESFTRTSVAPSIAGVRGW